jgi:hypothetical protein
MSSSFLTSKNNPDIIKLIKEHHLSNNFIFERMMNRFKIGYERYGQGVDIHQNSDNKNYWQEMALEEIEDCIVYLYAYELSHSNIDSTINKLFEIHNEISSKLN